MHCSSRDIDHDLNVLFRLYYGHNFEAFVVLVKQEDFIIS